MEYSAINYLRCAFVKSGARVSSYSLSFCVI
nr:MAG TPA: hypothetical protein [Caudoviricetes sp.]